MASLSPGERKELGQKGAKAKWAREASLPAPMRAICGSEENPLIISDIKISCYVLEDEKRIVTLDGMKTALELSMGGASARLAEFMATVEPNSATAVELATKLAAPLRFTTSENRRVQYGYEASLLADICESVLDARQQGRIASRFDSLAVRAEILIRGFARVGINALIDEFTGYQFVRPRNALAELLRKWLSGKLLEWAKAFGDDYYVEIFRLKGWDYLNLKPGDPKPSVVGWYTRNIVYERLPVPVIYELEKQNPPIAPGVRRHKHHQFLTKEIGHPELKAHIGIVTALMKVSETWDDFRVKLRKVLPKKWEQFELRDLFPDAPKDAAPQLNDGLD